MVAHNLLAKDLYTPIVEYGGPPINFHDGNQNDNRTKPNAAALGIMVDFISMRNGVPLSNDVKKSRSNRSFLGLWGSNSKLPNLDPSGSWHGNTRDGSKGGAGKVLVGSEKGARAPSRSDCGVMRNVSLPDKEAGTVDHQSADHKMLSIGLSDWPSSSTSNPASPTASTEQLKVIMTSINKYRDAFIAADLSTDPYLANLGRNLVQNTLLLPDKVQGKPLFVTSMMVLKQYGFLQEDAPKRLMRFLAEVEQG